MIKGRIVLGLMMGPVVPVPVPKAIIDALTSVQVKNSTSEPGGFQLSFTFSNKGPLTTLLLLLGQVGPFIRCIITVTVNGTTHVLMDGMIGHHQVTPNMGSGETALTVSGVD